MIDTLITLMHSRRVLYVHVCYRISSRLNSKIPACRRRGHATSLPRGGGALLFKLKDMLRSPRKPVPTPKGKRMRFLSRFQILIVYKICAFLSGIDFFSNLT